MRRLLTLLLMFLTAVAADGQTAVGHWRDCLDYSRVNHVAPTPDGIYAAGRGGLFRFDPDDMTLATISRATGLSDVGIATIAYGEGSLVVGYTNSNIDILQGSRIHNLSDIKRSSISGDRNIYSIRFHGGMAYLCTGFGVVVVTCLVLWLLNVLLPLGECFRSPLPCPVQAGRIAPYGFHIRQHCLNGRRAHLCRRRIVGVYHMITQVISSFHYYTPIIPPVFMVQGALTAFRSFASAYICILHPGFKFFSYSYSIYFILCQWVLYGFDEVRIRPENISEHLHYAHRKFRKQSYKNLRRAKLTNRYQSDYD